MFAKALDCLTELIKLIKSFLHQVHVNFMSRDHQRRIGNLIIVPD